MTQIVQWIDRMKGYMTTIGYSVSAFCLVVAAIVLMTSGGGQGMEKGKKWILGIAIGVGILSLGGAIITTLSS